MYPQYIGERFINSRGEGKRLTSLFGGEMINMNYGKGIINVREIPHGSGGSGGLSGGGG
jgi:hypothetical protein